MTPNMTFTKTSQKFGQWADHRVNTIYGLGFSSEGELIKVRYLFYSFIFLFFIESIFPDTGISTAFPSVMIVGFFLCHIQVLHVLFLHVHLISGLLRGWRPFGAVVIIFLVSQLSGIQ